ncbi:MAG: hypothetical protein ACKV0T_08115 [Planctomycetales bacterium]
MVPCRGDQVGTIYFQGALTKENHHRGHRAINSYRLLAMIESDGMLQA